MGERRNAVQPQHPGGALDRVDQSKSFVELLRIVGVLFQRQHGFNQVIQLLFGFIQKRMQVFLHLIAQATRTVDVVRHG